MNNGINQYNYLNPAKPTEPIGLGVISITGGEKSALSYNMPANSSAFMISPDTNELFMRSVDLSGMTSTFRAFDLKEKMPECQSNMVNQNYATKDDFNKLSKDISDLKQFLEDLTKPGKEA